MTLKYYSCWSKGHETHADLQPSVGLVSVGTSWTSICGFWAIECVELAAKPVVERSNSDWLFNRSMRITTDVKCSTDNQTVRLDQNTVSFTEYGLKKLMCSLEALTEDKHTELNSVQIPKDKRLHTHTT